MTTAYSPGPDWATSNRYIVSTEGGVLISNTGGHDMRWLRTQDDQPPGLPPKAAHLIRPGQSISMHMKAGDHVWLSADPSGAGLIDPIT